MKLISHNYISHIYALMKTFVNVSGPYKIRDTTQFTHLRAFEAQIVTETISISTQPFKVFVYDHLAFTILRRASSC